jgi:N-acetylglutamate synthase-like GNAT family acetyltransferase
MLRHRVEGGELRSSATRGAFRLFDRVRIRPARTDEAAMLSDLCARSKAVWGYDRVFMARVRAVLEVRAAEIAAGDVWVAETEGRVAGVVALAPGDRPDTLDLAKLFVMPGRLRRGIGRALFAYAVAEARRRGARHLTILADPNAAGFYEASGAVRIGEAPSDAIPGRRLPLYEIALDSAE